MLEYVYINCYERKYIMEEFVNGLIISYDGLANKDHEVIFETSHVFPNSIMDVHSVMVWVLK